jgi:mannosyl-oligosaccharide alpha-1,2-mannosidase
MYDAAIQAMIDGGMMKISPEFHLMYFGKMYAPGAIENSFSHLACFAGAMFALGSVSDPEGTNKARDMDIAKNITNTCHESYVRARTKLGPESFSFHQNAEAMSTSGNAPYYILRPEVVESYFTLYRLTGDPKYRDWGWDAALAIEKYCKAKGDNGSPGKGRGYSGITNVNNPRPVQDDVQQTFFLAETLKYLYLLFSSPDLIDLNSWVFNTEAHPLPIKGKNPMFSPRSNTLQD